MPKAGFDLEEKNQPYWYSCDDVNAEKGYLGKGPKKNDPQVFGFKSEPSNACHVKNMKEKMSRLEEKNELANQMWEIVRNPEGKILTITLTCQIIVQQILLFFGGKNTCTTLLGPTHLSISEIFPSKPDFHLYK